MAENNEGIIRKNREKKKGKETEKRRRMKRSMNRRERKEDMNERTLGVYRWEQHKT